MGDTDGFLRVLWYVCICLFIQQYLLQPIYASVPGAGN